MASYDDEDIFAGGLADRSTSLMSGQPLSPEAQAEAEKNQYDILTRLAGSVPGFLSGSDIFNMARDVGAGTREMLPEDAPSFIGGAYQVGPPIENTEPPLPPLEDRLGTSEYFQKMLGGDPQNPVSMVGDVLSMVTQPEVFAFKALKAIPFLLATATTAQKTARSQQLQYTLDGILGQLREPNLAPRTYNRLTKQRDDIINQQNEIKQSLAVEETFDLTTATKAEKQAKIKELSQKKNTVTDPNERQVIADQIKELGQSINVRQAPTQEQIKKGLATLEKQEEIYKGQTNTLARNENLISPSIASMIRGPQNLKGNAILEWTRKNTKPQELEYLGLDDFIKNNPNATMDEAIQHASSNQVRINKDYRFADEERPSMEFTSEISDADPLDGSTPWDWRINAIKNDIEGGGTNYRQDIIALVKTRNSLNESDAIKLQAVKNEDPEIFMKAAQEYNGGRPLDDFVEEIARNEYYQNPYEMITPNVGGDDFGNGTFAYGNNETGYSIFVDGNRIYPSSGDGMQVPFSRTEAEIQLRDAIVESEGDPYRLAGEVDDFGDDTYKQFIDENLPGGSEYREVSINWDNADVTHDLVHSGLNNDGQNILHALVRNRKLEDGTGTLHIDELQSDLHQKGSKRGYAPPREEIQKAQDDINVFLDGKSDRDFFDEDKLDKLTITLDDLSSVGPAGSGINSRPAIKVNRIEATDAQNSDTYTEYFNENDIRMISRMIKDIKNTIINIPNSSRKKFGDMAYDPESIIRLNDEAYGISASVYGSKEADMLVKALGEDFHKLNDLMEPLRANSSAVPNYPYKDDWHKLGLKQMLLEAIEKGDDAISTSPAKVFSDRYSDEYKNFYSQLYDEKIPAEMQRLADNYGGKFEKGSLDLTDTYGAVNAKYLNRLLSSDPLADPRFSPNRASAKANILRITPEMKQKILAEGLEAFAQGGLVQSIDIFSPENL